MKGLKIMLYADTASFRDPNTHLYQETLPAPLPSNIVGLAGAALGVSFKEILEYFKSNKIGMGYIVKKEGFGKDLWNYSKIKPKEVVKDILIREFYYGILMELCFACEDNDIINQLHDAFRDPIYALTLGNSDELIKIISIDIIDKLDLSETKHINNTWIAGNYIRGFELNWDYVKSTSIKLTLKPPIVKNLPVDFTFNSNDEREASRFHMFTFFEETHILKRPIVLYKFKDIDVPLYIFEE